MADPTTIALFATAARAAAAPVPILIDGPSGAGKEVLARHVHGHSPRAAGPFIALNCAALPEAMAESLLFGHERGAFTGAHAASLGLVRAADGGTLFLDEIGELPLALQAKLLRLLQEHEVLPLGAVRAVPTDCRIIAATNRDLFAEAATGRFRADLLWRLAVFPLRLPPLAERRQDILPLAEALLTRLSEHRPPPSLTPAAAAALLAHDWPGNVRELHNVLARALILGGGAIIQPDHLSFDPPLAPDPALFPAPMVHAAGDGLRIAVRAEEVRAIEAALLATGGHRRMAARRLGIAERTLRYKLAALAGRPRGAGQAAAA